MSERIMHQCKGGGSSAKGYYSENGFTVIAGSVISKSVSESFDCASKSYSRLREKLHKEQVIVDGVFQRDYEFSSPTAAAAVVTGWTISGHSAWKIILE